MLKVCSNKPIFHEIGVVILKISSCWLTCVYDASMHIVVFCIIEVETCSLCVHDGSLCFASSKHISTTVIRETCHTYCPLQTFYLAAE